MFHKNKGGWKKRAREKGMTIDNGSLNLLKKMGLIYENDIYDGEEGRKRMRGKAYGDYNITNIDLTVVVEQHCQE